MYDLVLAREDRRLGPGMKPSEIDCVAKARSRCRGGRALPGATADARHPELNAVIASCRRGLLITDGMEGDTTMENLARLLRSSAAGRPIVDKTGLYGSYRIEVSSIVTAGQAGPALILPEPAVSLHRAAAQLGLKLESSTADREVLVIDRLERPTEN